MVNNWETSAKGNEFQFEKADEGDNDDDDDVEYDQGDSFLMSIFKNRIDTLIFPNVFPGNPWGYEQSRMTFLEMVVGCYVWLPMFYLLQSPSPGLFLSFSLYLTFKGLVAVFAGDFNHITIKQQNE